MKKRLLIILITVVLALFVTPPVSASSGSTGTEVTAKADAVYVFAAPAGVTMTHPQTQAGLGDFVVSDLLLESGEWLTVTVIPGALYKTDSSGATLSYRLTFNPPGALNQSHIGQRYGAAAEVDPNALQNASAGTYQALLRFLVISHPDDTVVWQGTAVLTVIRSGSASEPLYSSQITSSQVTTSLQVSSQAASTVSVSSVKSKPSVVTIESEPTPGTTPEMGAVMMGTGIVIAALAISALIVLTRMIGKKKKSG